MFVVIDWSSAPRLCRLKKNSSSKQMLQFFSKLKVELCYSAIFFKEMVKTKSDLHKNLDNFYIKRFDIETMYHEIH